MSLHKLTAGDGYTYLTRQVAAHDDPSRGRDGLAAYYAERGESPGVWLGSAATGQDGFPAAGEPVAEAQMVALFGEGRHPDADRIEGELLAAGGSVRVALAATQLGRPYRTDGPPHAFRVRLAGALGERKVAAGRPRTAALSEAERSRVRTALAREMFTEVHGRAPHDGPELAGFLARVSRPAARPVAGYDLTFTPVKSVSALWAVAPIEMARVVEAAHRDAVADVVGWLERTAVFSRLGDGGVRQVEVTGLLAVAFTHRDSRAGDPNLHTHVAISNKVRVADTPAAAGQAGQWRALDGRPLHALAVAASERYNTRLEALLVDRLGVAFADRQDGAAGKRAVREIVGIDPRLSRVWSSRQADIDARRAELATRFQAEHGRPATPVEAVKLAQQATLETRQAKHERRSQAEQRTTWRQQALTVLGGPRRLEVMLADVRQAPSQPRGRAPDLTAGWVADAAELVLATVQSGRATWQQAHVRAEAERQVRAARVPLAVVDEAVERVVASALSPALSVPLGVADPVVEPRALRRSDGTSVYSRAGSLLFTSVQVLAAEQCLVDLGGRRDGRTVPADTVELAVLEAALDGPALNDGQAALVREPATSGARVQLALAPAGTGKTTALAALTRAWTSSGGTVLGLAPSAAAAAVLGEALTGSEAMSSTTDVRRDGGVRVPTDTLAKLLWSLDQLDQPSPAGRAQRQAGDQREAQLLTGRVPGWMHAVGPGTLVLVDEAGMAGTVDLARAVEWIVGRGGSVRLVGDTAQLAAVGAGGVLRDLEHTHGAARLQQVVRFTDRAEAAASLALRDGDPSAVGFYLDNRRVHVGDPATAAEQAYAAWQADRGAGKDSLLLAATRDTVTALNQRARADRLAVVGGDAGAGAREVSLADGNRASVGDVVLTRRNDRRLTVSSTDWVKNGDRWTIQQVLPGGGLRAVHARTGLRVVLPAAYVAEHVQLGYATTVHTAQGSTADTSHTVLTGSETRQLLYVAASRGRTSNHLYLQTASDGDEHALPRPDSIRPATPGELLTRILARDGAQSSATSTLRELTDPAGRLAGAADRYTDSLHVAAARTLDQNQLDAIDHSADRALPGLTSAPAWPALRDRLVLLAAAGRDPAAALHGAIDRRHLLDAQDPAAVLHARLGAQHPIRRPGPLPWLPPVPAALAVDPLWGSYLTGRAQHVRDLAEQTAAPVSGWTGSGAPAWATPLLATAEPGDRQLLARLAVWRAVHRVPDSDLRPTGPPHPDRHLASAQRDLDDAVTVALGPAAGSSGRWAHLTQLEPRLTADAGWGQLTRRIDAVPPDIDTTALLVRAVQDGPLPDEMPAAALWWRLTRTRPAPPDAAPAPRAAARPEEPAAAAAAPTAAAGERWRQLAEQIDPRLSACSTWRSLAAALDRAHRAGYDVNAHLPRLAAQAPLPEQHPARALHYRLVDECPAAVTPLPATTRATEDRKRTTEATARLQETSRAAAGARPSAVTPQPAGQGPTRQHLDTARRPSPGVTPRGPAR